MPNVKDARDKAWRAYSTAYGLSSISLDRAKGLHLVSWAVVSGCEQLARDLVRDGTDLNLVNYCGRTALSYAAECANIGLAHFFWVNGTRRVSDAPYRGSTLSCAADVDGNKLAQLLLFLLDTPREVKTRWFLRQFLRICLGLSLFSSRVDLMQKVVACDCLPPYLK